MHRSRVEFGGSCELHKGMNAAFQVRNLLMLSHLMLLAHAFVQVLALNFFLSVCALLMKYSW